MARLTEVVRSRTTVRHETTTRGLLESLIRLLEASLVRMLETPTLGLLESTLIW